MLARVLLGVLGAGATLLFALIILGAALGSDPTERAGSIDHSPAAPANQGDAPVDPSSVSAVLAENPLYGQGGLANGNCPAQDLGSASTEEQTRFYESLMNCLNEEWGPPIEGAGGEYTKPGLVVFESPVSTPCGNASPEDGRTLAFYCPNDSVLYADVPQMRKFFGSIDVAYAVLIGHEFGHHVQFETGMLDAYDDAVYDDYDARLILSRRVELQASCFGGLFLGAIAASYPVDDQRLTQLERVAGSFGDQPGAASNQRDHGSGTSNHDWILRAFNDNDLAACNTFTAPSSDVD